MKKHVAVAILAVALSATLAACGGKEGSKAKNEISNGIEVTDEKVYQYDLVNPSGISVTLGSKGYKLSELPEGKEYSLGSPVYSNKVISVEIDGKNYSGTAEGYVEAVSFDWRYDGKTTFPSGTESGEVDPSKVTGVIEYADGTTKDVNVEYASVNNVKGQITVTISDGVNTFSWDTTEEGVEEDEGKVD